MLKIEETLGSKSMSSAETPSGATLRHLQIKKAHRQEGVADEDNGIGSLYSGWC
jgi:hypothetical protein